MALTNHPQPAERSADIRRVATVAAGDVLAFVAFAVIGTLSHNSLTVGNALFKVAENAGPFMLGWFAIAPFTGAYRLREIDGVGPMLKRTALTWLPASIVGLLLRSLLRQSAPQPVFWLITFVTVLLLMGGWRSVYAVLARK